MKTAQKSISWLLIATILLVVFLPAHYHLHHLYNENDTGSANPDSDGHGFSRTDHAHIIDLHVLTEQGGQSHHDENDISIAASPDGRLNKSNLDFPLFILLVVVLLLLPILGKQLNSQLSFRRLEFRKSYHHFTPLLRAPPLY